MAIIFLFCTVVGRRRLYFSSNDTADDRQRCLSDSPESEIIIGYFVFVLIYLILFRFQPVCRLMPSVFAKVRTNISIKRKIVSVTRAHQPFVHTHVRLVVLGLLRAAKFGSNSLLNAIILQSVLAILPNYCIKHPIFVKYYAILLHLSKFCAIFVIQK